ncbi:uncharacterized protein Bfra_005129 [Botrytis fragariae]|uniref:Uncharacterized protein n=1 Tax=Botrytis fragariae TaxID=1964551 RepID=A0A8H6AUJ4_9HELO|nr:uncharacterized protein Bfra_005129 [Botrytis fragariae]KAF5873665.1 hypothetical protein Bfra_005129 [Botrytis fragariae]
MNPLSPAKSGKAMSRHSSSEADDSQPLSLVYSLALSFREDNLPNSNDSEGHDGDDEDTGTMRAYVKKQDIPGAQMKEKVRKDLKRKKELEEMVEDRLDSNDTMVENGSAENQEPLNQNSPNRASGDRAEQYQVTHDGVAVKADRRRSGVVDGRSILTSSLNEANLNRAMIEPVDDQVLLEQMKGGRGDHSSISDGRKVEGRNGFETAKIVSETGEYDVASNSASSREELEYTPRSAPITIPKPAHFPWRVPRSILHHDDVEPVRARHGWGQAKSRTDRISPEQPSRVDASSFGHELEPKPTPRIMTEGLRATKVLYEKLEDISSKRKKT